MKNCESCRHWDNDPIEDFGECMQKPDGPKMYEMTDAESSCDRYDYVMPPVITVHGKYHDRWHVVILEWNVDEGIYASAFVSRKYWTAKDEAIDEAENRATNEMEYVSLEKFPYPCHEVELIGS